MVSLFEAESLLLSGLAALSSALRRQTPHPARSLPPPPASRGSPLSASAQLPMQRLRRLSKHTTRVQCQPVSDFRGTLCRHVSSMPAGLLSSHVSRAVQTLCDGGARVIAP